MNFPRDYIWLIPALPLLGFVLNGVASFMRIQLSKKVVSGIACSVMFLAFVMSLLAVAEVARMPESGREFVNHLYTWIHAGKLSVDIAFLMDPLSSVMILIITGVGFLIHVYSIGYMQEDAGFQRYFSYLNLFVFFMLILVLGENVLLMFVGWEGVGLCSYLLIGFWFQDIEKAKAGMKAFIVNRVGDFAFIIGFCLLYWGLTQKGGPVPLSFLGLREHAHLLENMMMPLGLSLVTVVTLLFFIGATGKSAQIPLYIWLPDAMAGPTPVSALIHAATMVTAGVYMIGRTHFLFSMAPGTMMVVATVGVCTALFAGTIGLVQNDIKKVLAYSTVSQLGYMFLGMGVGAFSAGIMHLMTHAFFKGLMFLGAGSVIHAMHHEQDMRKMGGLKDKIPWTYWTFMAGFIAIIGIPPFAGFFSKDEILWLAFSHSWYGSVVLWPLGFAAAGVTAFYMSRLVFMTFFGESRVDPHTEKHLHESPKVMIVPLVVLGFFSLVGGWIGIPHALGGSNHFHHWLESVFSTGGHAASYGGEHLGTAIHFFEYGLMILSVGIAVAGFLIARKMYAKPSTKPKELAASYPRLYRALLNKYYVDEIYQATVISFILWFKKLLALFDDYIVDGMVNLIGKFGEWAAVVSGEGDNRIIDAMVNMVGEISSSTGGYLRRLQTGRIQNYVYVAVIGVSLVIVLKILL